MINLEGAPPPELHRFDCLCYSHYSCFLSTLSALSHLRFNPPKASSENLFSKGDFSLLHAHQENTLAAASFCSTSQTSALTRSRRTVMADLIITIILATLGH